MTAPDLTVFAAIEKDLAQLEPDERVNVALVLRAIAAALRAPEEVADVLAAMAGRLG